MHITVTCAAEINPLMAVYTHMYNSQMVGLYRDPHGEKIFEISRSVSTSNPMSNSVTPNNATETSNTAANLRKKITELERRLTQVGILYIRVCACCVIVQQVNYVKVQANEITNI